VIRAVLDALHRLLHRHWPENATCRSGIVCEACRCGQARYALLRLGGRELWATPWTDDPERRRQDLALYSHEGVAGREIEVPGGIPRPLVPLAPADLEELRRRFAEARRQPARVIHDPIPHQRTDDEGTTAP
jgi:hypothetical protein